VIKSILAFFLKKQVRPSSSSKEKESYSNAEISTRFVYQLAHDYYPQKFFSDTDRFLHEVSRPNLAGEWSLHTFSSELTACIIKFHPQKIVDSHNISRMAGAVYNEITKNPIGFFVLNESNMGFRVRKISRRRSRSLDVICNEEIETFIEIIKSDSIRDNGLADLIAQNLED
jgi:hypothetical protein